MISIFQLKRVINHRVLLDSVDLSVQLGQRIGLVGNSGSGKSLLLRSMGLLEPWDSGMIHWLGQPVMAQNAIHYRRNVVYLHQRPARFEGSVECVLRLPFQLSIHRKKRFDRKWILEQLQILDKPAEFLDQDHDQLSGGESQLVAILRALQLNPSVLLLDEPTSALDAMTARQVEQLIENWYRRAPENHAFVWVSHDRDQIVRLCEQVYTMDAGRLKVDEESA